MNYVRKKTSITIFSAGYLRLGDNVRGFYYSANDCGFGLVFTTIRKWGQTLRYPHEIAK
jgi:hypothetical protein